MILHREGSVSMPGVNDEVERHARIRISYQDVDGNVQTEESDGLRAVCHQHEIDQLMACSGSTDCPASSANG
jgi:peptide deformylase